MTTHTKGPWEDNGNGLIYGQASGDDDEAPFVADVCNDGAGGFYSDEEQANGRLISAAPELLEALQDLLGDLPSVQGGICQRCGRDYIGDFVEGDCPSDDCPSTTARTAIAKATRRAA